MDLWEVLFRPVGGLTFVIPADSPLNSPSMKATGLAPLGASAAGFYPVFTLHIQGHICTLSWQKNVSTLLGLILGL